jgi:AcrR family transcriptional regulator
MTQNPMSNAKSVLNLSNQESKQLTRECIRTALLQLLKDEDFENITITSIIKRSGVSRAGFYRNYASKEDIIEEFAQITYEGLKSLITSDLLQSDPYQWLLNLFTAIRTDAKTFHLLILVKVPHQYVLKVSSMIEPLFQFDSAQERYLAIARSASLKEIVIDWFRNGMQESPEEMAQFFIDLFYK